MHPEIELAVKNAKKHLASAQIQLNEKILEHISKTGLPLDEQVKIVEIVKEIFTDQAVVENVFKSRQYASLIDSFND
jgi:type III secretion system FlhB-like substrate exporter